MTLPRRHIVLLTAVIASAAPAQARDGARLILNDIPTADHAPYYFAIAQHWYREAGIDLTIDIGKNATFSTRAVSAGDATFGIADLATAMVARGKGADIIAVMNIYANSPQGFYWLKSSGIQGPEDFAGHTIGNSPGAAARTLWPAFAKAAHIDPSSVIFVNIAPAARIASLRTHAVDITSDLYNQHDLELDAFGEDLGFQSWRGMGINLYGNSVIVAQDYMGAHIDIAQKFVQVSQRAFAACVADVEPCLDALMASVRGLDRGVQREQWQRIKQLMRSPAGEQIALGAFDIDRVTSDEALVRTYIGVDKSFQASEMVTNALLDDTIKLPPQ